MSIQNTSATTLDWNAGTSSSWIKFSKSNGRIAAGTSQTLTITVNRSGLTPGSYNGQLEVRSTTGNVIMSALMQVPSTSTNAKIAISPLSLDFEVSETELYFTIQNTGGSALDWTAETSTSWARLPMTSGRVGAGSSQQVAVQVSRSGVAVGSHSGLVQIHSNGGSSVSLSLLMENSGATVNVRDYGARGDGQTDDARAIEAAINSLPVSGGTVLIPAGVYLVSAIHIGPYRPIDLSKMSNVTIVGDGMDRTTLKLAAGLYESAAFMFLIFKSSNIAIKNLTLDMNRGDAVFGDEQSHNIRVVSSQGIVIDRVRFVNGPGDGVYLLGVGDTGEPWTQQVRIENSEFSDLWRNGVTVQRGVQDLQIRGNTFEVLGDQAVSAEPSGSGASPRKIVVENNYIRHSNANWAIAMSGARKNEPLRELTFRNNTIEQGSAYFLRIDDLEVAGNTIGGDRWHSSLRIENVIYGTVTDNSLTGVKPNNTEGILQLLNEGSALSSNIALTGNTVDANSNSTGIYVRDAKANVTISWNTLTGLDSKKGVLIENLLTTGSKRTNFTISNNTVRNFEHGIAVTTRGDTYSSMYVLSNALDHNQQPSTPTIGILFSVGGAYTSIAQVLNNSFGVGILKTIISQ